MRVRKRTKRKRALRQGAGFSVIHLSGLDNIWVAYNTVNCSNATMLDGLARKNPPLHHRTRCI